jgi:hypothetical protein
MIAASEPLDARTGGIRITRDLVVELDGIGTR